MNGGINLKYNEKIWSLGTNWRSPFTVNVILACVKYYIQKLIDIF